MPGSRWFHVAFLPTNLPPCVRGVFSSTECCCWEEREVRKTNAHQKHPSSRIQYTTQARFICVQKSSNFITSAYPFKFRFVSMERQYILRCTCKSAQWFEKSIMLVRSEENFFHQFAGRTAPPESAEGCLMQRPQTIKCLNFRGY